MTAERTTGRASHKDKPARRARAATYRQWGAQALLAAAATIGLAACTGGSSSPTVASLVTSTTLGTNSGGSTTTSQPPGDAIQLVRRWAACMRNHGDPNQADPTIDANKAIHLTWNDAIPGGKYGTNKGGQGNAGPGQHCRSYLTEAVTDLQGAQSQQQPSQAQLVNYSECMRANGLPDFPDPTANGGLSFNRAAGGVLNPSNPVFQNATKLCVQKTGVTGFSIGGSLPPGSIQFNGDGPAVPVAEFSARRGRRSASRGPGDFAGFVVAVATGLDGCGGSANSPHVARGKSTRNSGARSGRTTATLPTGRATALVDETRPTSTAPGSTQQPLVRNPPRPAVRSSDCRFGGTTAGAHWEKSW